MASRAQPPRGPILYARWLFLRSEVRILVSFLVIVDEDLRHKPAVVVEALRPLWDGLVLHPASLLRHPSILLPSIIYLYPESVPGILGRSFEFLLPQMTGETQRPHLRVWHHLRTHRRRPRP